MRPDEKGRSRVHADSSRLTVESTLGHYHVLRDGKPLRKQNGMPITLPFSPRTITPMSRRVASGKTARPCRDHLREQQMVVLMTRKRCSRS